MLFTKMNIFDVKAKKDCSGPARMAYSRVDTLALALALQRRHGATSALQRVGGHFFARTEN